LLTPEQSTSGSNLFNKKDEPKSFIPSQTEQILTNFGGKRF